MNTNNRQQLCSPPTQLKTFMKTFMFLIITSVVILSAFTTLKKMQVRLEQAAVKNFTTIRMALTTVSTTKSVSGGFYANRSCSKEDVYVMNPSPPSNQISFIATSKKVTCPRVLKPPTGPLPFTALVSYPGSGNTWTRHLLQQLTGIPTGSEFKDKDLLLNGFPSEGHIDNVVAVKTHGNHYVKLPLKNFKRIILVVRNIYHSILAESRRRLLSGSHTRTLQIDNTTRQWELSLITYSRKWESFMKESIFYEGPKLIVFYEDLKSDLPLQLERMADFLKCNNLKEFSFCCVLKHSEGRFHRKPNKQTPESIYNKDSRKVVNEYILKVANFIQKTHPNVSQRILTYMMPV